MEKLSKPINVAIDGSVLSFDEPRDSYYYEVYIDDVKVADIESERHPNFLGTTPDIGTYYDSVTVRPLFDVPVNALDIEYSLDGIDWYIYSDKTGITLNGNASGEPQDVFFRGYYITTGATIQGGLHVSYTVLKGYNIIYGTLDPKEAEYILQPTKCYVGEETVFSVSTVADVTEQVTKLYYIGGLVANNCTLKVELNEEATFATCKITNPKGDVTVTVYTYQSNMDDHDVTVNNGRFSPDPLNCVYYQTTVMNIYPNDGYSLPQRENISITGAATGYTYDFTYYVGEETQDYAIIQFVPDEEPCEVVITCPKVGA